MRRPVVPALTVLALLALTGCGTAEPTETPSPSLTVGPATPEPTETPDSAPAPSVTPGPVEVTPQAEPETEDPTEGMTAEQRYVYLAGQDLRGWGVEITDDQLLSAGLYICEQLNGEEVADPSSFSTEEELPTYLTAVDGISTNLNYGLALIASENLCPQP